MRDLLDHHEREMMMDLTGEARPVPQVGRSTVHAGASEGHGRGSDGINGVAWRNRVEVSTEWLSAYAQNATAAVDVIYAAAQRVVAEAGPMPLVSSEPWVEGDVEYEMRLPPEYYPQALVAEDGELDELGAEIGLPRARLVPRD